MSSPHLCHVFSTFAVGGPQLRFAAIANALGGRYSHTVVAMDGNFAAAERLSPSVSVKLVPPPPGKGGLLFPLRLRRFLTGLRPDLLLTYNWGAIDAVIGCWPGMPFPIVHAEDGFLPDEYRRLKRRRILTRRVVLNRIYATVVPSRTLLRIAREQYRLREEKVRLILNGVDLDRFQPRRDPQYRRGLGVPDEALLFGFLGGLRPEKNLPLLLRAFAAAQLEDAWLVLVGGGPLHSEVAEQIARLGMQRRIILAGPLSDPAPALAAFDVFVMSSLTEQMPIALLEAMACGLPAVCTAVGDTAGILAATAPPAVIPLHDEAAYAQALRSLAESAALRRALGEANRRRCLAEFSLDRMINEYEALYRAAIKQ